MSIIDLIPGLSGAKLVAGALVVTAAFGGGWAVNGWRLNGEAAELDVLHKQALLTAVSAAAKIGQERVIKISGVAHESEQKAIRARVDAVAARVAAADAGATADRLRRLAADTYASLNSCGATTAAAGPAGAASSVVLADVLGRLDSDDAETKRRGAEAAESLDIAYGKGLACQRSYAVIRGD